MKWSKALGELVSDIAHPEIANISVSGLQLDSRHVQAGQLFLAYPGHATDGRDYIEQAIAAGAVAILAERGKQCLTDGQYQGVPIIVVDNLRRKVSTLAGRFYDFPAKKLSLIGITGTNAKTSCSHLIMQLYNALGQSCGLIGTLGCGVDGAIDAGFNTTPDAISIQRLLAEWQQLHIEKVVMEVSSHGLQQGRVAGLAFTLTLFTNLSRDHLDYHGSMAAYAAAKALLFAQTGLAVLNADDAYTDTLIKKLPAAVRYWRYSVEHQEADVWVDNVTFDTDGVNAILHSPWGSSELHSPLLGRFNLSNVIAVVTVLAALGVPLQLIIEQLPTLCTVPGRMQRIENSCGIDVVVDYAHTPAALAVALQAMRLHSAGKLWCVFGCGGDRDRGKRALMGEVAKQYADEVIVTSDNSRNESAASIAKDVLAGCGCAARLELDRATAIRSAIEQAQPGDSILIAGKGHETYQQIGDQRLPFSDIEQARLVLVQRMSI